MKASILFSKEKFWFLILFFIFVSLIIPQKCSIAYSRTEHERLQLRIIDHRYKLNPSYKKIKRKKTKYIIVHTSELGLKYTLRVISKGKQLSNRKKTSGGHAHYVIGRNGRVFRTLDKQYLADHAGLSMWNGETGISKVSVGIELAGYHFDQITSKQYKSLSILLDILKGVYHLSDRDILTHSQIAYGKRNRWFRKNHRGRKRCAKNFVRSKAGLGASWLVDPDVKSGRLLPDPQLAGMFYGKKKKIVDREVNNIISKTNSAWSIAGEDYDDRSTVYKLPNGSIITGDLIHKKMGWDRIPEKTIVFLNQSEKKDLMKNEGPIKTVSNGLSAWSLAGRAYNRKSTFYFLPSGKVKNGSKIKDWDDLPGDTKLIIGYRGPYKLKHGNTAIQLVGSLYKNKKTIYYLPSKKLIPSNQIHSFGNLPIGTMIFIPVI